MGAMAALLLGCVALFAS